MSHRVAPLPLPTSTTEAINLIFDFEDFIHELPGG